MILLSCYVHTVALPTELRHHIMYLSPSTAWCNYAHEILTRFYNSSGWNSASLLMAPGVGIEPTGVSSQQISSLRPYDRLDNPADLVYYDN